MSQNVTAFKNAKNNQKLTMLTAYDYSIAKIFDNLEIDAILVGDSLGMVMQGNDTTLSVTMNDMITYCSSVSKAIKNSLLICDMPFLSYQTSIEKCIENAGLLITKAQAHAVKLEGGCQFVNEIKALTKASIPVMGHIGLMPQSVHVMGGYKVQGKTLKSAQKLLDDARAIEDAGAFSIVLEGVPTLLAKKITESVSIPIIGIGSGPYCDGQILVWQDMMNLTDNPAKFVRIFGNIKKEIENATKSYIKAVKDGSFPNNDECYNLDKQEEIMSQLK